VPKQKIRGFTPPFPTYLYVLVFNSADGRVYLFLHFGQHYPAVLVNH